MNSFNQNVVDAANELSPCCFSCYLGCITREKSELYLSGRRPGTYLIRDSRSIPGDFVLSVR